MIKFTRHAPDGRLIQQHQFPVVGEIDMQMADLAIKLNCPVIDGSVNLHVNASEGVRSVEWIDILDNFCSVIHHKEKQDGESTEQGQA
jgi:hypothetical protein